MNKKQRIMTFGFSMLSVGFLFNPTINVIDMFPDLFGYLLLSIALRPLADLSDTVGRARELFFKMIFVDAAKLCATLITFGLSFSAEQDTMLLLVVFVFAVIELYLLIPAYKHLFSGLCEIGYRYENVSVLACPEGKGRSYTERISAYTVFFIIFKAVVTVLPEFLVLTTQSPNVSYLHLYDYVGLLRSFSMLLVLIFGLIWVVKAVLYILRIRNDKVLVEALVRDYREKVLPKESIFIRRAVRVAFMLICVAAFLMLDARLDGTNALPDALAAVFLALGFLSMKKYLPSIRKYIFFTVIFGVTALASDVCEVGFFSEYYYGAIIRSEEAYAAYITMAGGAVLETIGFAFAVCALISFFKAIITSYTGFEPTGDNKYARDKVLALHRELSKKLYLVAAGAVLCGLGDIFYPIGARYIGFAGLISAVCSVIFFATVVYAVFEITDEINAKYMLE